MVLETHMKLRYRATFSGKNFFCRQNWENGVKMGQQGFLNLLKNMFIDFYSICFIKNIKSHIWENFCS